MTDTEIVFTCIYAIDVLLCLGLIFVERKNPKSLATWILAFIALPLFSWFFYLMWGTGPRFSKRKWVKRKVLTDELCSQKISEIVEVDDLKTDRDDSQKVLTLNLNTSEAICTLHNEATIFTSAAEMYDDLFKEIQNATSTIHVLSYIFRRKGVGKKLRDLLVAKAKEGVKVKVCFDDSGNLRTPRTFFYELFKYGSEAYPFFPSVFRGINLNFNYRNHRKIIVIDGKIGYIGGMNIGDEYLGKSKKITPWRDTHVKIIGESVVFLQKRFLQDFYFASFKKLKKKVELEYSKEYFQFKQTESQLPIQIIASGPNSPDMPIKYCYERMILGAHKKVYIQTPYFVPDESFLNNLIIAARSGVEVNLMIPKVYDQRIPYRVSLSFAKDLLDVGANVYLYHGFIHSKTLIMDREITSIGSANMDIRSFALNFEANAIFYGEEFADKNIAIFEEDVKNSTKFTLELYHKRTFIQKIEERIYRIFAALM